VIQARILQNRKCEKKLNRFYTLADRLNVAIAGGIIILAVLASASPSKQKVGMA
jgi:hypothetical protein